MSLPTEVLTAISQLPLIQSTLQAMNSKINEISEVQKTVQEMKADIWENPDGIESRLNYIGQQSGENFADTEFLKRENKKLRKDIDLLKAMVIKLDRRSIEQEREIVELKSRSMRDNILIHNLAEEDGENLKERVKRLFKEHLGLEVDFVRIHRNAPHKNPNGKPRSITGKLVDLQQKEVILTTQRQKLNTKVQLPFYVTPQSPPQINENRNKLHELNKEYRENGTNTRVVGDKLIFPNGNVYIDKVTTPKAEDILTIDDAESEKLEKIELKSSTKISEKGKPLYCGRR